MFCNKIFRMFSNLPYYIILDIIQNWFEMEYNCKFSFFKEKFNEIDFYGYFKFDFTRKKFFLFKSWKICPPFISKNKMPILKMLSILPLKYINIDFLDIQENRFNLEVVYSKNEITSNTWLEEDVFESKFIPINKNYLYKCEYLSSTIFKYLGNHSNNVYIRTAPTYIKEFLSCKTVKKISIVFCMEMIELLKFLPSKIEEIHIFIHNKYDNEFSNKKVENVLKYIKDTRNTLRLIYIEFSQMVKLEIPKKENLSLIIKENKNLIPFYQRV